MRIRNLIGTAATAALLTVSTAAGAAPAARANPAAALSPARAATATAKTSRIGASVPAATLINVGILAALTGLVLVLTSNDDDSDSN